MVSSEARLFRAEEDGLGSERRMVGESFDPASHSKMRFHYVCILQSKFDPNGFYTCCTEDFKLVSTGTAVALT